MKKRVLALVLGMIMCLSIVFTSCSLGGKDIFDVYKSTPVDTGVELGATASSNFEVKGTIGEKNAYYVEAYETNEESQVVTYSLYSVATGKAVKTISVNPRPETGYTEGAVLTPTVVLVDEYAAVVEHKYYEEAEDEKVTITVYNAKGEQAVQLANVEVEGSTLEVYEDHILVNDVLYRVDVDKEDVATYVEVVNFAKTTLNKSAYEEAEFIYTGKEYVCIGDGNVTTFDETFAMKAYVEVPEYDGAEANAVVLRNGNVLIQYMVYLPDDASDYDIYWEGETKVAIENKLLKASTGKLSDAKYADVLILDTMSADYDDEDCKYDVADDCVLAYGYKIVDGLMEEKTYNFLVNNSGKVTEVEYMDGIEDFEVVSEDKIYVEFAYGSYLYNSKGKVIATFTEAPMGFTKSYIIFEDKITTYDDMETSVRAIADDEEIVGTMYNDLIFIRKTTEATETAPAKYTFSVYGAGSISYTSESSENPFTISDNYFSLREVATVENAETGVTVTTTTVSYYSITGTKLYSYSNSTSVESKTKTTVSVEVDSDAGILVIYETKTTRNENAEPTVVKTVKAFTEVVAE